ncbi:MAG TPA: discoidin domain-containing protein, partial [Acidimicrobiales bacterium]|nr:discoidin domain-containing protein [Acidimicrobiales bacterium]
VDVDLTDASQDEAGQTVTFPERSFSRVSIEILADSQGTLPRYSGQSSIGFSEVELGGEPNAVDPDRETVRLPTDLLDAAGPAAIDHPLAVTLTRQRQDPTDPARTDEERSLVRTLALPSPRSFALAGTARLSPWADPEVTGELIGRPQDGSSAWARSSDRPTGAIISSAAQAFDGDPTTAWSTDGNFVEGQWIEVHTPRPVTIDSLPLTVVADGVHSLPAEVTLSVDGDEVATVDVPELDDTGPAGHTSTVDLDIPRVRGSRFELELSAVDIYEAPGAEYGDDTPPVAIAEIGLPGPTVPDLPRRIDTGCRDDLLTVDDHAVPLRVRGTTADALASRPLTLTPCGDRRAVTLRTENLVSSTRGTTSGIDLDQLVLRSAAGGAASTSDAPLVGEAPGAADAGAGPRVEVVSQSAAKVRVHVSGATGGTPFWLVLGQSFNAGWTATADGGSARSPELVDGFANGWRIDPRSGSFDVELVFTPQRSVDIALWVSLIAGLLCVALAFRPARRTVVAASAAPEAYDPDTAFRFPGVRPGLPAAALVALALGVLGWLLAGPAVGVVVGVAAAAGARYDRSRRWILVASAASLALAAAYVLYIQVVHHPDPSLEWPYEMRRAHPLGWLAVLLLAVDVAVNRVWQRGRHHDP